MDEPHTLVDRLRSVFDDPSADALDRLDAGRQIGLLLAELPLARQEAVDALETVLLHGIDGLHLDDPESWLLLAAFRLDSPATDLERAAHALQQVLRIEPKGSELRDQAVFLLAELSAENTREARATGGDLPGALAAAANAWSRVEETAPTAELQEYAALRAATNLAERLLLVGHNPDDLAALAHHLQRRPRPHALIAGDDGPAQLAATGLLLMQGYGFLYEQQGRPAWLEALAEVADSLLASGVPDPRWAALTSAALAGAILTSPDGSALVRRLPEVPALLQVASAGLPPGDEHRPQVEALRLTYDQRRTAPGTPVEALENRDSLVELQKLHAEARFEGDTGTALTGALTMALDTRFRHHRDLRDVRAARAHTLAALDQQGHGDFARTIMQANLALSDLQMSTLDPQNHPASTAVRNLRKVLERVPTDAPQHRELLALIAIGLLLQAGQTRDRPTSDRLVAESRQIVGQLDGTELADRGGLLGALAGTFHLLLENEDAPGERLSRFQQQLAPYADVMPPELVTALRGATVRTLDWDVNSTAPKDIDQAQTDALDETLAEMERSAQDSGRAPDNAFDAFLAMERARLLRVRDAVRWRQMSDALLDAPVVSESELAMMRDWARGGVGSPGALLRKMTQHSADHVRDSDDRRVARTLGLEALNRHALRVLRQSGTRDAITTARAGAGDAHEVAAWCLRDGATDTAVRALESGRGLTLLAVQAGPAIDERLRALGFQDLAEQWTIGPADGGAVPDDVRHRVIDALAANGITDVLPVPTPDEIARALRTLNQDLLIYLVPRDRDAGQQQDVPPGALVVSAGGTTDWVPLPGLEVGSGSIVERYLQTHHQALDSLDPHDRSAWREALDDVCRSAWDTTIAPLSARLQGAHPSRPARVVLVPADALCVVPWHAASPHPADPGGRRALRLASFSQIASAALLVTAATRPRPQTGGSVVLVGDPGGDLPYAQLETRAIRSAFYPDAQIWGKPPHLTDGAATQPRLRGLLASGSCDVLHYAGHATVDPEHPGASCLDLGPQRLRAEVIMQSAAGAPARERGLCVCLAGCTTHLTRSAFDEALTLSSAFMVGGASSVIGSLWRLRDASAAVMMFMLHRGLHRGLTPVQALHRAQSWMLNPDRSVPPEMPADLREVLAGIDPADPVHWAGLVHQGA
ncbi:CHAT domain-containing protein [Kineosporia rhizophila]|uniref:CHAT domain-containing protein n=1 Tax=Kineosporia rhizophila TaxID=84633 RepID=UPI001E30F3ED|nr:CHAT domain-containing protein [Kineosporia rhizophila]MCE0537677.1 CHAT domain-containing protein [Kineosporia rhizophila]